eukprot:SAG31_NODE_1206_length_9388_cov_7.855420_3_plen_108_part_00
MTINRPDRSFSLVLSFELPTALSVWTCALRYLKVLVGSCSWLLVDGENFLVGDDRPDGAEPIWVADIEPQHERGRHDTPGLIAHSNDFFLKILLRQTRLVPAIFRTN